MGKWWRDWGVPVLYLRSEQTFVLPAITDTNVQKEIVNSLPIAAISTAGDPSSQTSESTSVVLNTYYTLPTAQRVRLPLTVSDLLIGREKELESIVQTMSEGKSVLLHGMGGMGKTALAARAAQSLHEKGVFQGGVLWISDVGTATASTVWDAVARRFDDQKFLKSPSPDKTEAFVELLESRKLLLVLDDVATAATVESLLACCQSSSTGLLVTSRHRSFAVGLFRRFDVDIPILPLQPSAANTLFESVSGINSDEYTALICSLLENHPLAIVIAAARARTESMTLSSLH